jgi:hypothetical protein
MTSKVDKNFDFLIRCSDGRSETMDVKISSNCIHFATHMLNLKDR